MKTISFKKVVLLAFSAVLLIFCISMAGRFGEDVDAGEIVVIQDPIDGELHIYTEPGWVNQNFGTATHYKKSFQFWFSNKKSGDDSKDESVKIRFNDGGHATISGSCRVNLPTDEKSMRKLHTEFRSQEAIEQALVKTTLEKSIYMTGPLMSSKESYAEKRNDLLSFIEDQAINGVYKTITREVKVKDELSNSEKTTAIVEIATANGSQIRQERSPIKSYNLTLQALSINSIDYDKVVEAQIASQQQAIMQVQTAMANSKKAEQDAITAEMQGKAAATKAKWDQEVTKAQLVTKAESDLAVQELSTKQAALYKQQQILEGEGEAAKKKLIMAADGALDKKLEAWVTSEKYKWDAFAKFQGNLVPQVQTGNSNGSSNGLNYMEVLGANAALDLGLKMKPGGGK